MKLSAPGHGSRSFACRSLTISEVRRLPRIPSGYVTDRVFRVSRQVDPQLISWRLQEERLHRPFSKVYDEGDVDDWLESYGETSGPDSMRFIGAFDGSELLGLATWTHFGWNDSLWLADIRVRRDRHRKGVGTQLMREVKTQADKLRVRGIRVETQVTNYPAIQFYRGHGFVPSGLDDHLYSNRDLTNQEVALFLFWERA